MPELQVWSLHPHPRAAPLPPILSVPAEAKLPSQPSLSCTPLPAIPRSWWHIQMWQCHFPSGAAGVSQAPTERGCCWQCPRMPGEQSGSPCCHTAPKTQAGAWWEMVWAWQPLLPACLGHPASSWAEWSRSWKRFSCWQLHSLCPEPARFLL